jgi:hypothetical protein
MPRELGKRADIEGKGIYMNTKEPVKGLRQ